MSYDVSARQEKHISSNNLEKRMSSMTRPKPTLIIHNLNSLSLSPSCSTSRQASCSRSMSHQPRAGFQGAPLQRIPLSRHGWRQKASVLGYVRFSLQRLQNTGHPPPRQRGHLPDIVFAHCGSEEETLCESGRWWPDTRTGELASMREIPQIESCTPFIPRPEPDMAPPHLSWWIP